MRQLWKQLSLEAEMGSSRMLANRFRLQLNLWTHRNHRDALRSVDQRLFGALASRRGFVL